MKLFILLLSTICATAEYYHFDTIEDCYFPKTLVKSFMYEFVYCKNNMNLIIYTENQIVTYSLQNHLNLGLNQTG